MKNVYRHASVFPTITTMASPSVFRLSHTQDSSNRHVCEENPMEFSNVPERKFVFSKYTIQLITRWRTNEFRAFRWCSRGTHLPWFVNKCMRLLTVNRTVICGWIRQLTIVNAPVLQILLCQLLLYNIAKSIIYLLFLKVSPR